ncbi:helix-turn-helix domain-containing protein [Streptomyces sp. RLB3-6]|uniref:helix-turn-helix transcriptional regulator n=1 Tax=unclassified Streptomyces TaxID=2593676 RepID=UPI00196867D4|nr:helix-turn-helix domain-containing protein [Streptomyces sp. RLB3-6]
MMQDLIEKISTGVVVEIEWLTPLEVAKQLRVHPGTLANWRYQGIGPRYTKLSDAANSPVRYRSDDVDAYMHQQERGVAA